MPDFPATLTMPSEGSKAGVKYRAANGGSIVNKGERKLQGYTSEANLVDMSMQVCDVTKPLGSVRAMLKAGNRVVFDEGVASRELRQPLAQLRTMALDRQH